MGELRSQRLSVGKEQQGAADLTGLGPLNSTSAGQNYVKDESRLLKLHHLPLVCLYESHCMRQS